MPVRKEVQKLQLPQKPWSPEKYAARLQKIKKSMDMI